MKGKKRSNREFIKLLHSSKPERLKLFDQFIKHLSNGFSVESFYLCTVKQLYDLIAMYEDDFCKDEIEIASQKGREWWERLGKAQAEGVNLGNSRTWWYNMAHRYGWSDKVDVRSTQKADITVNVVSYADANK